MGGVANNREKLHHRIRSRCITNDEYRMTSQFCSVQAVNVLWVKDQGQVVNCFVTWTLSRLAKFCHLIVYVNDALKSDSSP
jgi:hypothetical protein